MNIEPAIESRFARLFNRKHKQIRFKYRLLTARQRVLPNFLILGARYSGTASLVKLINQHPKLHGSFQSQIHYFDGGLARNRDNFLNGEAWYRAHFPKRKELAPGHLAFEASTFYSFHPLAAKRLYDLIPDVKIIFVLRDPVQRAIHQYNDAKRQNHEYLPLINALQIEEKRLAWTLKNKDYKSGTFLHATYKSRGHYKEQISRYMELFGRDKILLVGIEELSLNPEKVFNEIYQFLGIDNFVVDTKTFKLPKFKVNDASDVNNYLQEYFNHRNQSFYEFSGKAFNW